MYSKVQELEGRPKERMFDEINILQEAVSRLERGMQTETKKVTVNAVVEIEDDSCAGGACKI